MMEIALLENVQREDLNAVEEALGYRSLIDSFALTQEQVAKRVGKSRAAVTNALRLLNLVWFEQNYQPVLVVALLHHKKHREFRRAFLA